MQGSKEVKKDGTLAVWDEWAQLLQEGLNGSEEAYDILMAELAPVALRYCYKHIKNRAAAQDCAQEALYVFHRARESFDHTRNFRSWFFTILRNKVIDFHRRKTVRQRHETINTEILSCAYDERTGRYHARRENKQILDKLLETLKDEYREVIVVTKLQGKTTTEACKLLGLSESALRVRLHRALQKLKENAANDSEIVQALAA